MAFKGIVKEKAARASTFSLAIYPIRKTDVCFVHLVSFHKCFSLGSGALQKVWQ